MTDEKPVELTFPKCKYKFIGWVEDDGSQCFDCFVCTHKPIPDALIKLKEQQ